MGILPAHISGAHESLPKGAAVPRARKLRVAFGPFLSSEWLVALTSGLTSQEGWRLVAAFVQRVVEHLRDGVAVVLDSEAARAAWNGETQTLGVMASRVQPSGMKKRFLRSVS